MFKQANSAWWRLLLVFSTILLCGGWPRLFAGGSAERITFYLDGNRVKEIEVSPNQPPVKVNVSVSGGQELTISYSNHRGNLVRWINPKLIIGGNRVVEIKPGPGLILHSDTQIQRRQYRGALSVDENIRCPLRGRVDQLVAEIGIDDQAGGDGSVCTLPGPGGEGEVPAEQLLEPGQSLNPVSAIKVRAQSYSPAFIVKGKVNFRLDRQWEWFECSLAVPDDSQHDSCWISTTVDRTSFNEFRASRFRDPTLVRVHVADSMQLTLDDNYHGTFIINPRFSGSKTQTEVTHEGPGQSGTSHGGLIVDPQALTLLSMNLAKNLSQDQQLPQDGRLTVAVAPFRLIPDDLPHTIQDNVQEGLCTALPQTGRFTVVARDADMKRVLNELKISETGAIDPATAKSLGKLVQAQCVLVGSVSNDKYAVIYCRLYNTETGEARVTASQELRK